MDLDFSEEQVFLRDSVRRSLEDYRPGVVAENYDDDEVGFPRALWQQLADLDLLGLNISEADGGSGRSLMEVVIVSEEFGRALLRTPFLESSVLCATLLRALPRSRITETWLRELATGDAILIPAWLEPKQGFDLHAMKCRATRSGSNYIVRGQKDLVPYVEAASRLVLIAQVDGDRSGLAVLLVDPSADGVRCDWEPTMAREPHARVMFNEVAIPVSQRLDSGNSSVEDAWAIARDSALVSLAAYAIGGAEQVIEMATDYATNREQFGVSIGSFQAISHPLADIATELEGTRVLVYQAAMARQDGHNSSRLAAMAKLYAADVFKRATKVAHQTFGGVGFTTDLDLWLYFRKAKQMELLWWNAAYLEEQIVTGTAPDMFMSVLP